MLEVRSGFLTTYEFTNMISEQAYPLSWPPAWPRTAFRREGNFWAKTQAAPGQFSGQRRRTVAEAVTGIMHELKLLGVGNWNVIVSTNLVLNRDGLPRSDQKQPLDPGAAVYFKLKDRPAVLACDKWSHVQDNLWAMAKDIEAQRGRIRWGVGTVEQAFAGYMALPPAGASAGASWWNILGCAHDAPFDVVKDSYKDKARAAHPDNGGSHDAMVLVNAAWDQARKSFGQ